MLLRHRIPRQSHRIEDLLSTGRHPLHAVAVRRNHHLRGHLPQTGGTSTWPHLLWQPETNHRHQDTTGNHQEPRREMAVDDEDLMQREGCFEQRVQQATTTRAGRCMQQLDATGCEQRVQQREASSGE